MSLPSRIKQARLLRILLVYIGASWVVLQAADLLQEGLDLPDWVVPVTLILLLVGLLVVGATAWVQASASTDRKEARGEVPSDWELDLRDLGRSLRRGRLPHLTWGRALAAGGVAFLALFAVAAVVMLVRSDDPRLGASELSAEAAPGLAVLPFTVSGPELQGWREGLMDLLSRNLDGLGAIRAIDSRTVLARWRETVRTEEAPDLATTLEAAARTGARWALVGSAVEVGSRVRVAADLYEVSSGRRLDRASAEGPPDSLLAIVDRLSVDAARSLLSRDGEDLTNLRLASITTSSPEALRAFLEGEAAYRRSSFRPAIDAYQRATRLDPLFALAHFRLGSALGWLAEREAAEARRVAYRNRDRLPAREALLVEAEYLARTGRLPEGVALLREGVRRYPDHAELWYQLGDVYLHWGPQLLLPDSVAEAALLRAVALDPSFGPFHIHLVDLSLPRGDSASLERRIEAEAAASARDTRSLEAHRLAFAYIHGPREERPAVLARATAADPQVQAWLVQPYSFEGERAADLLELASLLCQEQVANPAAAPPILHACFEALLATGRIDEAGRHLDLLRQQSNYAMPVVVGIAMRQTGMDPDGPTADPAAVLAAPSPGPDPIVSPGLFFGGLLAVEQGRTELADSSVRMLERAAEARLDQGDTVQAGIIRGFAEGVGAYAALAAGTQDDARRRLERARDLLAGSTGPESAFQTFIIWPLADLYAAVGRHEDALRHFEALRASLHAAPALLRRAEIHEAMGDAVRGAALRREFMALWSAADPRHPLIERARRGLPPD